MDEPQKQKPAPVYFGVIDETELSLRSPRAIDEGPYDTLSQAFVGAYELLEGGAEQVAIVRVRYSKRHEVYVEITGTSIEIDARDGRDLFNDDESEG
jgi:hypothetical protein